MAMLKVVGNNKQKEKQDVYNGPAAQNQSHQGKRKKTRLWGRFDGPLGGRNQVPVLKHDLKVKGGD